jgi:hypothetical protein
MIISGMSVRTEYNICRACYVVRFQKEDRVYDAPVGIEEPSLREIRALAHKALTAIDGHQDAL